MNFEEYMKCHEDNNGFIDNNFGALDPCYGMDPEDDVEENDDSRSYGCKSKCHCSKCHCNRDCDDPCEDEDAEYIDNGLNGDECRLAEPVRCVPTSGTLNIASKLDCAQGEPLGNAPVSLYKIDNGCDKLIATKKTDENGLVTFNCLENGVYRVEQNLDPCLFECAQYYPSSIFAIRPGHKTQKMVIVHKRRNLVDPCTMRAINKAVNAAVRKALCCCKCCRCCKCCKK